jgi:endonuclease/exonuclease/phosphatase family metal-dependent hydrolase
MFPVRLSVITCNLWGTTRWSLRKLALKQFVEVFCPDILCLQELCAESQSFLDNAMPQHNRVHDDFPGWICESNIYWKDCLLKEVEHGADDIGIIEENRRLFWVRLKLKEQARTVFVSTAHFTYKAHPKELETGLSPRLEQTHRTVKALQRLVRDGEPALFMGDLNDTSHPIYILYDAGYRDCFSVLGVPCVPTAPCYPTANIPIGSPTLSQTLDWIVSNKYARTVAAQVPHFYHGDVALSDHWPVLAVFEI